MKRILIISLLFSACSQNPKTDKADSNTNLQKVLNSSENKFPGVDFASKKDLACGMPLSAGVDDTVHYKGKIYGFCSPECKDSFMTDPEKYVVKK